MHLFCKAHKILQFYEPSVIQDCPSGHPSEHLMLVRSDNPRGKLSRAIQDRFKLHFKASVTGCKLPGFHIVLFRDMKLYVIQLMRPSAIKNHILRCGGGVSEPVSDIKPERFSSDGSISGSPVPCIVISPYSTSPVQSPVIFLRGKQVGS